MPTTDRDFINSAMGGSQDPNQDDYQSAMGGVQPGGGVTPPNPGNPSVFATGVWNDNALWNDNDIWKDVA